jgi:hypothetical protein
MNYKTFVTHNVAETYEDSMNINTYMLFPNKQQSTVTEDYSTAFLASGAFLGEKESMWFTLTYLYKQRNTDISAQRLVQLATTGIG